MLKYWCMAGACVVNWHLRHAEVALLLQCFNKDGIPNIPAWTCPRPVPRLRYVPLWVWLHEMMLWSRAVIAASVHLQLEAGVHHVKPFYFQLVVEHYHTWVEISKSALLTWSRKVMPCTCQHLALSAQITTKASEQYHAWWWFAPWGHSRATVQRIKSTK